MEVRAAVLSGVVQGYFRVPMRLQQHFPLSSAWTREPLPCFMTRKIGLLLSFTWSYCYRRLYIDTVKDTGSLTSCAFVKEHSSSSRISTVGTFFTVLYEACPLLHASSMWTQQWHMAPVRIRGRDGATLAYTWVMNERGASRTSSKSNLVLC